MNTPAVDAAWRLAGARQRLARLEDDFYLGARMTDERFDEMSAAIRTQIDHLEATAGSQSGSPKLQRLVELVRDPDSIETTDPAMLRALVTATVRSLTIAPAAKPHPRLAHHRFRDDQLGTRRRPARPKPRKASGKLD